MRIGNDFLEECMLDEDDNRESCIYEFLSIPSYVSYPVHFVLVEKEGQATEKLQDRCGHVILSGKLYVDGQYLQKSRSRNPSKKRFNMLFVLALVKFLKHLLSLMMI